MTRACLDPDRISIGHAQPDVPVQQVLDKIEHPILVVDAMGEDGVQGVIEALARRTPPLFSLDLIAHARRGVMHLGDWSVDGNPTTAALHDACAHALSTLDLAAIRLLGCNTAISPAGQAAMRSLHELFAVPIFGTKVPISARDFDRSGFLADAILTDQDNPPPATGPTLQSAGHWFDRFERLLDRTFDGVVSRLRGESPSQVFRDWTRTRPQLRWPIREISRPQLDDVLCHLVPTLAIAPGLLALPELELVAPVDPAATAYHRLTVLLDGYWLRLYPDGIPEGIVLAVDADPALFAALSHGRDLLPFA